MSYMTRRWARAAWPLLAAASLALFSNSGARAGSRSGGDDPANQIEREFGVLGNDTSEGRRLNRQLTGVVDRIIEGLNRTSGKEFQLRSARLLGGKSEKNDQVVNAFALPDGRIYVTLGLMRLLQDSDRADDELAFVVGHEVTHVIEKHSAGQQKKALPLGIAALLLGAVNKTAGQVGQIYAAGKISHFSRVDEYRADRGGLRAMDQARFDLDSAITMLNRLKQKGEQNNRALNGLFGSHPLTENRVDRIRKMIDDLHSGRDIRDRSERDLEREDRGRSR
jgi:predicted Zn-dependent protease